MNSVDFHQNCGLYWGLNLWLKPSVVLRVCPHVAEPLLKDREDQFGRTPLMYCVLADRLDCAEILLKAGASVNKTDLSQRTALHLAAQKVRAFADVQVNTGAHT